MKEDTFTWAQMQKYSEATTWDFRSVVITFTQVNPLLLELLLFFNKQRKLLEK